MCCDHGPALRLPPAVIEMLARYRDLHRRHGWDWGGEDLPATFRWARFQLLGPVLEHAGPDGDWAGALRAVIGDEVPAGIVLIGEDGRARTGAPRPLIPGRTVPIDVVTAGDVTTVDVGEAQAPFHGAVRMCARAELRLRAPRCARWSVTDGTGGAWFPDGVPAKWDVHGRPFFHAAEVTVAVPAVPLTVTCTRGLEFGVGQHAVDAAPDGVHAVDADPPRLIDPAADGWYGGDLHVHLNYSGDLVCAPQDAARMQHGEGLHLMNLVAGNLATSRVYDRELLESTAGDDLWSGDGGVARMGVEYRNDLLGHVHASARTACRSGSTPATRGPTRRTTGRRTPPPAPSCGRSGPPSATRTRRGPTSRTGRPTGSSPRHARWRRASWSPTRPWAWSTRST